MTNELRERIHQLTGRFILEYVPPGLQVDAIEDLGEIIRLAMFRREGE